MSVYCAISCPRSGLVRWSNFLGVTTTQYKIRDEMLLSYAFSSTSIWRKSRKIFATCKQKQTLSRVLVTLGNFLQRVSCTSFWGHWLQESSVLRRISCQCLFQITHLSQWNKFEITGSIETMINFTMQFYPARQISNFLHSMQIEN